MLVDEVTGDGMKARGEQSAEREIEERIERELHAHVEHLPAVGDAQEAAQEGARHGIEDEPERLSNRAVADQLSLEVARQIIVRSLHAHRDVMRHVMTAKGHRTGQHLGEIREDGDETILRFVGAQRSCEASWITTPP